MPFDLEKFIEEKAITTSSEDRVILESDLRQALSGMTVIDSHLAPGAEEWIEWEGGEFPVSPESDVEFVQRNGLEDCEKAEGLDWYHDGTMYDIIRYRIKQ